jgi:uridine kinase
LYDFSNHTRKKKYLTITPRPIVIVEGVLIFHFKELANLFSLKIFLDIDPDIRFIRRLKRDVKERKRQVKDICKQYLNFVKPMHELFVEKTKYNSDIVLKYQYDYNLILDIIKNNLVKINEPRNK